MAIIPIIFLALVFGFGSFLGGSSSTVTEEAVPEPSAAASPVSPSSVQLPPKLVRSMFKAREELRSCGTLTSDSRGEDAWACLQDAADAGEGAELVRRATTDEGDPITSYYRVSYGELEIFTDNSLDAFRGDPAWTYDVCQVPDDVRSLCPGS